MDRNVHPTEWKPRETTGKHWQADLHLVGEVPSTTATLEPFVIKRATFSGVLNHAAKHSGMDDQDIADAMPISHGYMSKFMRGVAEAWVKRLIRFMHITKSLAPLQWIADQMGCDVVIRHAISAELAQARARVAELERGDRMLA